MPNIKDNRAYSS